jgi:methionine synthase I (cobalamin-dependent)
VIDEKLRLGNLHNSGDYPSVAEMDAKFHMSYTIDEIPDSFITDLEESAAKQINDIYQEQHKARMKKFSDAVWTETRKNIEKLRDALSYTGESKKTNPDFKIFKDSTYTHVQRTVEVLERFNFTGDANMQTVQKILRNAMSGKSADMLKHNESLRLDTKKALDDAIANLPSLDI